MFDDSFSQACFSGEPCGPWTSSNINLYMIYYYHLSLWRSVLYSDGYLGKELYTVILFIKSNDMKTHCLLNKLQKLFFSYLFTIRKYSSEKTDSPASLVTWISMITFLIKHEHSTWLTPVKNVPFSFIME